MTIMLILVLAQCFLRSGGITGPCLKMILMKWKTYLESSLVWEAQEVDQDSDTELLLVTQDPDLPIPLPPITESHTLTTRIGDIFELEMTNILKTYTL